MTAICKTLLVHGKSALGVISYGANKEKTSITKNSADVENLIDYSTNPLKTICGIDEDHKELLVSGIKCTPESAAQEFEFTKQKYLTLKGVTEEIDKNYDPSKGRKKREPVTAIHLIQSFAESDIDPHVIHEIGCRLAESVGCQAVVCTHMNTGYFHNHIVLNAYMDNGRKVLCNTDFIMNIRELSDEIQREYGIPIEFDSPREQLFNKNMGAISRTEWIETINGTSWKDQMRYDIATIADIAQNKDEYLSIMESYGYIAEKETPQSITFRVKENNKKIKDKTLGVGYSVGELFPPSQDKNREVYLPKFNMEERVRYEHFMGKPISISLYDHNGRMRGPIEMLIRAALAIIQAIGDMFFDARYNPKKKTYHASKYKIELMNDAIDKIKKYEITDKDDLNNKIDKAGANLSHAKKRLALEENLRTLYNSIDDAVATIDIMTKGNKIEVRNLKLHEYSDSDIRKAKACLSPMTGSQKRHLSQKLAEKNEYRLVCRFEEISSMDAENILSFLNGTSKKKPDLILTTDEYEKRKIRKTADSIFNKRDERTKYNFKNTSPDKKQLNQAMELLSSRGIEVDATQLSLYDVISVKNCFGINPFDTPIATEKQQNLLRKKMQDAGIPESELSRPLSHITGKEVSYLLRYLNGEIKTQPELLKPYTPPDSKDVQLLRSIMEIKDIHTTVPIEELSQGDFNKMFTYAIYHGHIPDIINPIERETNLEKDNTFYERVSEYTPARAVALSQLRNAYNTLRSLGFDIRQGDSLNDITESVESWKEQYQAALQDKEKYTVEYADLSKIKQAMKYAIDPKFIYGDLYNPEIDRSIEVKQIEEKDSRSEEEDKKQRSRLPDSSLLR